MRYTLTFLLLSCYTYVFSCYNEFYALDAKGRFHQVEVGAIRFQTNFDLRRVENQLAKLGKKLQSKADFKVLSDYGLYLVRGGKVKEALILFEALAKAYPNEYSIISNLGTTYELSGNNVKALEYIRKGLKLNPDSHDGSEWIHVKLLLAKIALEKDPHYFEKNTILKLTPKQEASEAIRKQLFTQLRERFPFCKGPDPVMADLLIDLGDCYTASISFEHANGLYQIAKLYYQSERTDIEEKIKQVRKLRSKYAHLQPEPHQVMDGSDVGKITGVPYESYLKNPNADNYLVNWSKIETDPKKLLAFIHLKLVEEPVQSEQIKPAPKKPETKKVIQPTKTSNSPVLWMGLVIVVFILSIFTYFKARKRK
ncbi:hypothetical protein [uncultured Fluviicola sp.]|uniref:tetratricopeptide repeat protein n=1 Tax=uncultured Fluviicola sp. TaxID=463303 RepID=UPI0025F1F06F|nr:hypothetical protein [uncultured Fluviicola sp.]